MRTSLPKIETERLLLREINEKDMYDMYEYAHLPFVGPVAGWEPHISVHYTRDVISSYRKKPQFGQLSVFAVVLKESGKMIGTCELHSYIRAFKAELGYTINPSYWGNGYALEAARAMLYWGFEALNLKRIECCSFVENIQSKRVCEKLGLTYEGIRRKGYQLYDGNVFDLRCYSITDDEFLYKKSIGEI